MLKSFVPFTAALACLLAFADVGTAQPTMTAQETIVDKNTGKTFPKTVSLEYQGKNYNLYATGVATRSKLIVKVYSIAHYMEPIGRPEGNVFEQILNNKGPKQFTSIWLRNIDRSKVIEGYRESLGKAAGNELNSMNAQVDKFLSFFGDVKANDEHVLRWLPDGTLEVYINKDKKGAIKDEKFARAVWSIWFGNTNVVKRDNLVSLMK